MIYIKSFTSKRFVRFYVFYVVFSFLAFSFVLSPAVASFAYSRSVRLSPTNEGFIPGEVYLPNGDLAIAESTPYVVLYSGEALRDFPSLDISVDTVRIGSPVPILNEPNTFAAFICLRLFNADGGEYAVQYFAFPSSAVSDSALVDELRNVQIAVSNIYSAGGSASIEFTSTSPETGIYYIEDVPLYQSAWDLFAYHIYGNSELTPDQHLVLTFLATFISLFVVTLPFLACLAVCKWCRL